MIIIQTNLSYLKNQKLKALVENEMGERATIIPAHKCIFTEEYSLEYKKPTLGNVIKDLLRKEKKVKKVEATMNITPLSDGEVYYNNRFFRELRIKYKLPYKTMYDKVHHEADGSSRRTIVTSSTNTIDMILAEYKGLDHSVDIKRTDGIYTIVVLVHNRIRG